MMRHKKRTVFFVLLCGLSLLVAWDVYAIRRRVLADPGFDSGIAEVRRFSGEEGVFRVQFSRLRDANEANTLLAARSHLELFENDGEADEVPDDAGYVNVADDVVVRDVIDAAGRRVGVPSDESEVVMDGAGMKFRPLNLARNIDIGGESENVKLDSLYQNNFEEDESPTGLQSSVNEKKTAVFVKKKSVSSNNLDLSTKHVPHSAKKSQADGLRTIFNSTHNTGSDSQRRTTAVDAIKKLLLYNETESARALWALTQNQQHILQLKATTDEQGQGKVSDKEMKNRQFRVKSPLSWPVSQFTRTDILQSHWVQDLKNFLKGATWRQISVVTSNQEHLEVVLNWLVAAVVVAKLPLQNILVLSLSPQLHGLLVSKKVNSLYIPASSVISSAGLKRITTAFNQIHIVRLTLFRLMNHWDYDVVMYDSDAVVLKNPQPLFDASPDVELIGSAGKGPESIGRVWGRTICTGVLLMRSSPALESWWEKMSQVARLPFTDQGLVNIALKSLHIHWDQPSPLHMDRDMRGTCPGIHLQALVLSEEKMCRYSCESHKRSQYYVWHKPAIKRKRTVENKKKRAREGGAWFLKEDWAEVSKMSSLTGITWLLAISQNS